VSGIYVIGEIIGAEEDGAPRIGPFVKVGIADSAWKRKGQLQTANPRQLIVLLFQRCKSRKHAHKIERLVHAEMTAGRVKGEWFQSTAEQVEQFIGALS
jgi:hypothetical protein